MPLKPNYTKDFGYIVEDVAPTDWIGNVELKITKIEFEDKKNSGGFVNEVYSNSKNYNNFESWFSKKGLLVACEIF